MITLCPNCKEYIARCNIYKFCCYCGWLYNKDNLIEINDNLIVPKSEYLGRIVNIDKEK